MSLLQNLKRWAGGIKSRIEQQGLSQQPLTVFFPLSDASHAGPEADRRLRRALSDLQGTPAAFADVEGLHSLRFALIDDIAPRAGAKDPNKLATGPLILECLHDGDREDLVYRLFEVQSALLEPILAHCHGYPGSGPLRDRVRYVLEHRCRSGYVFRDRRLSVYAERPAADNRQAASGSSTGVDTAIARRVSKEEIVGALELRRQLVELATDIQYLPDDKARASVLRDVLHGDWPGRGSHEPPETPAPAGYSRPFEQPIPNEGEWIRRAAVLHRNAVRRQLRDEDAPAVRAVHAKHHGLLKVHFDVLPDIPAPLQRGVFKPGARYEAWLRLSNTSQQDKHDRKPDGRGLAIKLLDVRACGPTALATPVFDEQAHGVPGNTQDFVLMSHPTFFVRNARDYTILRSILDLRTSSRILTPGRLARLGAKLHKALVALTYVCGRFREAKIMLKALGRRVDHPLMPEYHSGVAFLHGEGQAVKYSVRPATITTVKTDRKSKDYLREVLQQSLETEQQLEFAVLVPKAGQVPQTEDPSIEWTGAVADRIPLATIVIPPQTGTSPERLDMAQAMAFTPWHALADHKPLGGLNRARFWAYRASSGVRAELNKRAPEPITGSRRRVSGV